MKFIHTADVHLGSKINLNAKKSQVDLRRLEVRATFKNIVELAKRENATAILLCGDVFDGERALKKDKEFFYNVVKSNPDIDFLYLRGNHDILEGYSEALENLKLFSDTWTYYEYDGVTISGIEITSKNASSLYQTLNLQENRLNIAMLHGQVSDATGKNLINLTKLKDKNIDYLALGHVHSHREDKLDERGVYAYSGCPEGRGFDEAGEKSVVLLETKGDKISRTVIPTSQRIISNYRVDCAGLENVYDVYSRIKELCKLTKNDIYRIELYGDVEFDTSEIEEELIGYLKGECFTISVKDNLKRKIDLESLKGDVSLKGEFLRSVYSSNLTEDEKSEIASLGVKVLSGREI